MIADCKCDNGHEFSSRVTNWEPDVDVLETEDDVCPVCGANFVATSMMGDDDEL